MQSAHREIRKVMAGGDQIGFDDSDATVYPDAGLVCGGRLVDSAKLRLASPDYNFSGDLGPGVKGDPGTPWLVNEARCRWHGG